MFKIKLTARAKRELKSISERHKEAISLIFEELRQDAMIGKPLSRNLKGSFSYRVGVYRIVYKVNLKDKIVLIVTTGYRSTVYN